MVSFTRACLGVLGLPSKGLGLQLGILPARLALVDWAHPPPRITSSSSALWISFLVRSTNKPRPPWFTSVSINSINYTCALFSVVGRTQYSLLWGTGPCLSRAAAPHRIPSLPAAQDSLSPNCLPASLPHLDLTTPVIVNYTPVSIAPTH
ncbi:hypothetical protein B0T24DRAFT_208304 [Lasiosphaeria ovina]|uniref:Uncharacterized protein n=1 Tax=Lasiosphaeria ovina TaxID=92902 RepID=A0AAE0NA55_9PEZI|nr:hypothetical protein B0T24DRAFT_208304 [Lasiosphaeria ovina]